MPTKLPDAGDPDVLYIIDLSGYVFRAYHGVPPLSNSKGEPIFATLGVTNMLNSLVRSQRPAYLAVAMDSTTDTFRSAIYPAYKANRPPAPPDLFQQMLRCRQVAEAYAIPVLQRDGFEADDLIATCVKLALGRSLRVVVATGDKDLLQLVSSSVCVWDAMRSRVFGVEEVKEKWSVEPNRIRDLLSLMGDSSDNIPGVAHIGEKTAAKLIAEHGSLQGIYSNLDKVKGKNKEYLQLHAQDARLSYELVTLRDDIPIEFDLQTLKYGGFERDTLRALFKDLEFNKLAEALDKETKASVVSQSAAADYQTVTTESALDEAILACRSNGCFAVDTETTSVDAPTAQLVGVSLSWQENLGVYVPISHRGLAPITQLGLERVRERLGPLLADASVKKVGQNIKYDDIVLRRAGMPVEGYDFDTMLASYLIDPEKHSHKLSEISRSELGYEMLTYEQVAGTGKKEITFDLVDVATATRYSAEDAQVTFRLSEKLRPRCESEGLGSLMRDVEVPIALLLGRMEQWGVLIDRDHLKGISSKVAIEVLRLEKECHDAAGKTFNVNAPRQLETILFDDLKLPVFKRTKTGRSTDAEVLEELSEKHPLPRKILDLRSLTKLQGTYLEALPALADAHGRIHTSYNQAVAATGRLSSSNPNLQNIPVRTALGREIRAAFIAPKGHSLLAADYSQIELRVLAHLSGDPILLDAFTRGEDVHARTAMEIFKVTHTGVTKDMRARAKTVNFGVIYGQGEAALARQLGITKDEALDFITQYFKTFATLRKYMDDTVERARSGSAVRTLLGRRRFLPDLHSSNRALRLTAERMANNTPIQGTSADIIKLAMLAVDKRLSDERMNTRMVLTVHDELVLEVPDDEREAAKTLVRDTMQSVMNLRVPLRVECGWGQNWGEAH